MKTINDLLNDLAEELNYKGDSDWTKLQQLVAQIRWKLKEEQWKPR